MKKVMLYLPNSKTHYDQIISIIVFTQKTHN